MRPACAPSVTTFRSAPFFNTARTPRANRTSIFISGGIERLTGVPAAEYISDAATVYRNIFPEDHAELAAAIAASQANLSQFEVVVRHPHRITGEIRWVAAAFHAHPRSRWLHHLGWRGTRYHQAQAGRTSSGGKAG